MQARMLGKLDDIMHQFAREMFSTSDEFHRLKAPLPVAVFLSSNRQLSC